MKLRITRNDLESLTFEQKQNLCDLWIPHVYDLAVATVCVDAAEERYDKITFVIGGIKLLKHHDILLYDLKFMQYDQLQIQEEDSPSTADILSERTDVISSKDDSEDQENEAPDGDTDQDFSFDEDFNFEFQRPDSYSKQDCVPLLDIGQMIDILERKNFGQCDFSLSVTFDEYSCNIEKAGFSGGYNDLDKNGELCDVLWESVKALL